MPLSGSAKAKPYLPSESKDRFKQTSQFCKVQIKLENVGRSKRMPNQERVSGEGAPRSAFLNAF